MLYDVHNSYNDRESNKRFLIIRQLAPKLLRQRLLAQRPQPIPKRIVLSLLRRGVDFAIWGNLHMTIHRVVSSPHVLNHILSQRLKGSTHILAPNPLTNNLIRRRRKQRRATALALRIRKERPHERDADLPYQPIRVDRLLLLIGAHRPGVSRVDPDLLVSGLLLQPPGEPAREEEVAELGAAVEVRRADVLVYFVEGGELDVGRGRIVKRGGLHYEAGVRGRFEEREEESGEEEVREDVGLEMGIYVGVH